MVRLLVSWLPVLQSNLGAVAEIALRACRQPDAHAIARRPVGDLGACPRAPRRSPSRSRARGRRRRRERARVAAGEALEGALAAIAAPKPGAVVGDLELDRVAVAARARGSTSPVTVAQRVVDQVAERLAQPQRVGLELEPGRAPRPASARPRSPPRARRSAARRPRAARRRVERARGGRAAPRPPRAPATRRSSASCGEPVALRERLAQRLARLRARVGAAAQRGVELGLEHGDRRAQLVARVGDEAPLALERALAAARASRSGSRRAAGPRRGPPAAAERLVAALERDLRGAAPHRLDRPQPGGRQRVAEQRREQRRRPARRSRTTPTSARERLVAVLERLADDDDDAVAASPGAARIARLALDPGHRALERQRSPPRALASAGVSDRPARATAASSDVAVGAEDLREAVLGLPARARGAPTPRRRDGSRARVIERRRRRSRSGRRRAGRRRRAPAADQHERPSPARTRPSAAARIGSRLTRVHRPRAGGSRRRARSRATRPRTGRSIFSRR